MKLFESTWRDGFVYYERFYCTVLGKSVKKRIDLPFEYFEVSPDGEFEYILDSSIKLERKQGRSKSARGNYGVCDPMYRNIRDNYWGDTENGYNTEPRVFYLDIETRTGTMSTGFPVPEKALEPISLMQFYDNKEKTMFVLGLRDWVHEDEYSFDYPVKYVKCKSEKHLLEVYLAIFAKLDPLIIYAWYGDGFDFPYIFNRMKFNGIDTDKLSNYGSATLKEGEYKGKIEFDLKVDGHFYTDMKPLYQNLVMAPRPNYALDTIAEIELNENKVSHTEYAAFDDFYTGKYIIPKNPNVVQRDSLIYKAAILGNFDEVKERSHSEFVYYGIIDTYLIRRLDEKRNFTVLLSMIAEMMGVQIGEAQGTVKPWSQYISNKSLLGNMVMPPRTEFPQPEIVGGFVRNPVRGMHKWVLSADVNSMYPLLSMAGFNMSPETFVQTHEMPNDIKDIVLSKFNNQLESERFELSDEIWNSIGEKLRKHKLSLAINGAVFRTDKLGLIPELVLEIYSTRKKAKQTQFKFEKRKLLIGEIIKRKQ